jgi:hypothetical protein
MMLDLAPEERRALAALLKSTVNEGHPHSPRIRVLRGILARLEPPAREGVSILGRNAVEIRRTTARLIIRGIVSVLIVLVFVALRSGPSWVDWLIICLCVLWCWRAVPMPRW